MLTRRMAAKLFAASALAYGGKTTRLHALEGHPINDISVMMWTLRKFGSFEQNLDRVAAAGYRFVELVDEYKRWAPDERQRILARVKALGITIDAMTGMVRGFADPNGGSDYVTELRGLVPAAKELGCPQIILMSGKRLPGISADEQHRASIETLKQAAPVLAESGIVGLIEPIDHLENPTMYLDGVTEAFAIVNAVNSPAVKVLYDFYHEQRQYGNLIEKLDANIAQVGLVHIADVPGRHKPGTGEIDYANIYRRLGGLNYKGRIAMEFYPDDDVVACLRKAREDAIRGLTVTANP
jgi:hydroxypyruvate isomerase